MLIHERLDKSTGKRDSLRIDLDFRQHKNKLFSPYGWYRNSNIALFDDNKVAVADEEVVNIFEECLD